MKAILEFNLPEDSHEYGLCTSAHAMYNVICEMDQYLRSIDKYGTVGVDQFSAALIREQLHVLLSEQGITI